MKIQKLFLSILAAASLFAGCKDPEPEPTIPSLTVGQTELSFEQNGGTGNITVTSNRAWTISTDADWLAFNPSSGNAADAPVTVTVTALANSSTDRTASFKVKTDFDFRTVEVSQKGAKGEDPNVTPSGSGTANDPYNVAAALEKAKSLQAFNTNDDLNSSNSANVYTAGKVVSVDIDPSYGNATYYISADGTSTVQLEVYRGKYLEGVAFTDKDQLKVGDDVVVYGTLVNFKGDTPEYTTGSKLISVNGETKAPEIDYTKYELITVSAFIEKANSSQFYRLKGKVSKFNKNFCSFDLTDDSGTIYVYNVANKDDWSEKISNGGTVELAGLYTLYTNKTTGATQHEVVSAQILTFEAGSGSEEMGEPKGTGTLADPYNPAGAAAAVKDLTWTSNDDYQSTDDVYVKGKISRIADKGTFTEGGTYGNASFFISEDGEPSGEFQVYRVLYLGNKKFESGQTDIKVGDEVIIYGKLMNYHGNTPETVSGKAYLYSLNGVTGGDDPGPGGDEDIKIVTVAEFIAAEDSKTQPYQLTGKVSDIKSDVYGNFNLTDDSGTIYVYGLVSKDLGGYTPNKANDKSFASIGIKDGDVITIVGYRETFTKDGASTDEVAGGYYVSGASGTGGDDPGPGGDATEATVAEAIAAAKDAVLKVGPAVVVASSSVGFLIEQDGARIYVYGGAAAVGDNVTVEATRAEYQGVPQLTSPKVTVNSSGTEITYPTAKDITSSFASYSSDSREYVTFQGKLNISGNYYNITVDGSSTVTGSIPKPVEDIASLNGKDVTITGYYLYHTSQGKYLYVIPTKINDIVIKGASGGDTPGGDTPGGDVSGNTETIDFSQKGYANAEAVASFKGTNVTITFDKGSNSNAPKYYTSGTAIRCYGSNTLTISSSKTIKTIKFTFGGSDGTNEITADKGTFSKDTWTGSATSVKFTIGGTTGNRRFKVIAVTFAE